MARSSSSGSPRVSDLVDPLGYDAVFDPPLDRKYICPICLAALREAVQTTCGHRFCRDCIMACNISINSSLVKCPVDNTWINQESEIFPDVAIRREVLSLYVRCDNHSKGCPWTGELREVLNHSSECTYLLTACSYGCGEMVTREALQDHLDSCTRRLVVCEHCATQVIYSEMTKHQLLKCLKFPVNCTLCGRMGVTREEIPKHVDIITGDCPQAIVPCKYASIGCYTQETRQKIGGHYQEYPDTHMQLFLRKLSEYDQKLQTLEEQLQATSKRNADLHVKFINHARLLVSQADELERQNAEIAALQTNQNTGHLYWRLNLSDESSSGQLTSPSFYTGFPGYKVRACLELVGYKEGNESYASFFIVLQPGEFDDELYFPFNAFCQVTLYEASYDRAERLTERKDHITSINCTDMPQCRQGESNMDSKRGRLRYMRTEDILADRYRKNGSLYFDIVCTHTCNQFDPVFSL